MPRKKSIRNAVVRFARDSQEIRAWLRASEAVLPAARWSCFAHDYAIIRLHATFERLITEALVGAINNNTGTISARTGVTFPKHLTNEVCEYLVTRGGFLHLSGRDSLIRTLSDYVPKDHYLVSCIKEARFREPLDRLYALRNFAAHRSNVAKRAARRAVGVNLSSAGAWLRRQNRYDELATKLDELAKNISLRAPR